jgi:preflagellin peptidase FlaK
MIFTLLALFGATVASYTDLKQGIIQNKLTFSLFAIGILGHLILDGAAIVGAVLSSVLLIFAMGYSFWYLGGWSAGDAKEFLFLAALLPRYPSALQGLFDPRLGPYPFVVTIFANTFLAIFPFILFWGLYTSFKQARLKELLKPIKRFKEMGINAALITAVLLMVSLLSLSAFFTIPLILIGYKLKDRLKVTASIVIAVVFIVQTQDIAPIFKNFAGIFLAILIFRLFWNSISVVRKHALEERINVSELEEGMVPSEEIYIGEDKIETRARGLTMEEIERLKALQKQGTIEEIRVKKTIPFAPVILIGLLISLGIGDLIMVVRNG